jgi:hypothetical protein
VWEVPFFDREAVGLPMLGRMAAALFPDRDPVRVDAAGSVQTLGKDRDRYTKVGLDKVGDELVCSAGSVRRMLFLPRTLVSLRVDGATVEAGCLRVMFRRDAGSAGEDRAVRPPRGTRTEARETRG